MAPLPSPDIDHVWIAPAPESPTPPASLLANLICRIVLGILANILCWVPFRLLYRNGEFAATVFIGTLLGLNTLMVLNAIIWPNDDIQTWWTGEGWCDLHPYLWYPLNSLNSMSVLAINRNLAEQVRLLRANPLNVREKRRKNLIQALIMFPLPIIQIAWMFPITAQRYTIVPLNGCEWRVHNSWPYVVFFSLPVPISSIISACYAFVTYWRYRQLRKTTDVALSSDSTATVRQNRTRRRLYFLTVSIIVPFLPLSCVIAGYYLKTNLPLAAFDFHKIHYEAEPFDWQTIALIDSSELDVFALNSKYLPVIMAVFVFLYFGLTPDAVAIHRRYMLALGLGRIFPGIHRLGVLPNQSETMTQTFGTSCRTEADTTLSSTTTTITNKSGRKQPPQKPKVFSTRCSTCGGGIKPSSTGSDRKGQAIPAASHIERISPAPPHPSTNLPDLIMPEDVSSPAPPAPVPAHRGTDTNTRPETPFYEMLITDPLSPYYFHTDTTNMLIRRGPFEPGIGMRAPGALYFPDIPLPKFKALRRMFKRRWGQARRGNSTAGEEDARTAGMELGEQVNAQSIGPCRCAPSTSADHGHTSGRNNNHTSIFEEASAGGSGGGGKVSTHVWSNETSGQEGEASGVRDYAQRRPAAAAGRDVCEGPRLQREGEPVDQHEEHHQPGVTIQTRISRHEQKDGWI